MWAQYLQGGIVILLLFDFVSQREFDATPVTSSKKGAVAISSSFSLCKRPDCADYVLVTRTHTSSFRDSAQIRLPSVETLGLRYVVAFGDGTLQCRTLALNQPLHPLDERLRLH